MSGFYGADVSTPMSVEQWHTLMKQPNSIVFGIVRCYQSNGRVDLNAAASINAGWSAGLQRVDAYHFPCLNVSAETQINDVVQAFSAANVELGYYWIDVEPGAGGWSTDRVSNTQFLSQLIQAAQVAGLTVGIYTSISDWEKLINNDQFSQYPLWYAHWDDQANYDDLTPFGNFGGWSKPVMKQYLGTAYNGSVSYDPDWSEVMPTIPMTSFRQSSGTTQSAPGTIVSTASAIRSNVTTYASSIAGTSAVSDYPEYVSIIAPGETISAQKDIATLSSCGLTVAGIWRACGLYNAALNAPYVNGSALSRLTTIGQAAGGYAPYTPGMLPNPGDMVLLGTEEHVYTVISVKDQGKGNAIIQSVDGGQPSGAPSTVKGASHDAILNCTHTWTNGQDSDAYCTRPIFAIIDVTKVITSAQMPLAGFVQAAPPGTLGVDCSAAISSSVASALVAAKYGFCIRSISPNESTMTALTTTEAQGLLAAGLGLMVVQGVNASALAFSATLGTQQGTAAAQNAKSIGIPMCVNLWLRLDNIPAGTNTANLISYYNAWYTAVYNAGFLPGLCVGPTEVLNGTQLGESLSFGHYWQAAGVTVRPVPRGYQIVEGNAITVGGVTMNAVTAQNDAGTSSGQGPGQAEWLIAKP